MRVKSRALLAVFNLACVLDFRGQVVGKNLEPWAMTSRLEEKNVTINSIYKNHKTMGMEKMTWVEYKEQKEKGTILSLFPT